MPTIYNQDETKMYEELEAFLLAERTDLRQAATDAVVQVRDPEGMEKIVNNGLVKPLAKNCAHPDTKVSTNALQALVQLSSNSSNSCTHQCIQELMDVGGVNRLMEVILSVPPPRNDDSESKVDDWNKKVNLALALLANMTRSEEGAVQLLGHALPDEAVTSDQLSHEQKEHLPTRPMLELILARFLREDFLVTPEKGETKEQKSTELAVWDQEDAGARQNSDHKDPYQHFAAVLMNCTQVETARKFVLKLRNPEDSENDKSVLRALLPMLRSPNVIRRRGIAGVVRNCCLERDSAWWFLNVVNLTKHILYPLAGPEELDLDDKKGLDPDLWLEGPDKVRESDKTTRLLLVEAILLLCATGRRSRETLRLQRVYVVLKMADMVEEQEEISERISECVQFLRRDEEGTAEGSSDKMVEDLVISKPLASSQISMNEDFDDVD